MSTFRIKGIWKDSTTNMSERYQLSDRFKIKLLGLSGVFIAAAVGFVIYMALSADFRSQVIDQISMSSKTLVATPEEIKAEIAAAQNDPLLSKSETAAASGPLQVHPLNPRYFSDPNGQIVYLTGSHTWSNFQDNGGSDPPAEFDYDAYLDFLEAHNHNFFRLWTWENSRWTTETTDNNYWFSPMAPFERTGPGVAIDGKPRFDLDQFDQAYFDRLRQRVIAAGDRGIYVTVVLFNGWSVASEKGGFGENNPWKGHPFNPSNNINGIDGDLNDDNSGEEVHELGPAAITAYQEAYVKKVIDTVNDLDNVLYEISNESHGDATNWQYHMVNLIQSYQATKPQQHPVGMTVEWPNGNNQELFDSNADWIAPNDYSEPPAADGSKVIIADTDHIWGIGGDRWWVWKSFTQGINPIFMDGYDGTGYGVGGAGFDFNDPTWVSLRRNMGYTRAYAERINLEAMTPRGSDLCSSGYCLANPAAGEAEFLAYLPDGGTIEIDLTAVPGTLSVEWFDPENGQTTDGGTVNGGQNRSFTPPFGGDAVLYLYQQQNQGSVDLAITKNGPAAAWAGQPVEYTITVTNNGSSSAINLVITDEIPVSAIYNSGGTRQGSLVRWDIPQLAANSSVKVTFSVTANGPLVNENYRVTADGGHEARGTTAVETVIVAPIAYLPALFFGR